MIAELEAAITRLEMIAELEAAITRLEPPFLALPEDGLTPESLAYQRGAKHAYENVVHALRALSDTTREEPPARPPVSVKCR
jgi:hypothetical protein